MALESFGSILARQIDLAAQLCHDMVLDRGTDSFLPEDVNFSAGENGMWKVIPSMLDGKPAVEIRIAVG